MTGRDWLVALTPVAVGIAIAAIVAAVDPPRRVTGADRYVIPAGTADRVKAGLPVDDVLPQQIDTTVGRSLVVVNEDAENHVFGPFVLAPGQEWVRQFAAAGDYSVACSVYPATGFNIAVAPAQDQDGPAETARLAALATWAVVGAFAFAAGALALALTGTGGNRDGALSLLRDGALLLPGTLIAALVVSLVALSRLAPWRPVLASPVAMAGLIALTLAGAAALFVTSFLGPQAKPGPVLLTVGCLLVLLALGAGLWLAVRWQAPAWALAVAGAGLLAVAVCGGLVRPGSRLAAGPATARWLAAVGCGLFVAGLPWPAGNPAQAALGGLVSLAAAAALAALWLRGHGHQAPAGVLWLSGGASLVAAVWAATVLFLATAAHIEAMAVPLGGNPTKNTPESVARGEVLWQAQCAACHDLPSDVGSADLSDQEVLAVITHGAKATEPGQDDMPGFAYELDVLERGDLLNYLRAGER